MKQINRKVQVIEQMISVRLLSGGLRIISLFAFALCLLSGWLCYEFYFKWLSVFEDGRYFDPETGVVYHDSGSVWGVLSLATLLISIALRLIARKIKGRQRGAVGAEASI
jgi:hypothetical protein